MGVCACVINTRGRVFCHCIFIETLTNSIVVNTFTSVARQFTAYRPQLEINKSVWKV